MPVGKQQQPEPTRVMVNGAAVALLNSMFASLKEDLQRAEDRLSKGQATLAAQLDDRFEAHEKRHEDEQVAALDFQKRTRERLFEVEEHDRQTAVAQGEARAMSAGKWWLPQQVAFYITRYGKPFLLAVGLVIGFLTGLAGHVELTLH